MSSGTELGPAIGVVGLEAGIGRAVRGAHVLRLLLPGGPVRIWDHGSRGLGSIEVGVYGPV